MRLLSEGFCRLYLVIKDSAVKQGIDSLNQFILIVLEVPSRIAMGLFDITQETARYVAIRIPAKVNSIESLMAKKINRRNAYIQVMSRDLENLLVPLPSSSFLT